MKYALLSVTDKRGVEGLARGLVGQGYQILSTGGTHKALDDLGITAMRVEDLTGFPEAFGGRVKSLHPKIHGGILYQRDRQDDVEFTERTGIPDIQLVCVNLYRFEESVKQEKSDEEIIEEIDIGGPALIRSASKNFKDVIILTDPEDYGWVLRDLEDDGGLDVEARRLLACKAWKTIAAYDEAISRYFNGESEGISGILEEALPYGENPHQAGSLRKSQNGDSIMNLDLLSGKPMSYNNYNDAYAAMELLVDMKDEAFFCGAIKHGTLCGAASAENSFASFQKTYSNDPISIFGGVVAFNHEVGTEVATALHELFLEIIIAPSYTEEAVGILSKKKSLRILRYKNLEFASPFSYRDLDGYLLKQERDLRSTGTIKVVTKRVPTIREMVDMEFAMKIVKNIKSNGIVLVRNKEVLALGGGQTARIFALKDALLNHKGKDFQGTVLASDAFLPFSDVVETASTVGVEAIIQPGGSRNDQESINACDCLKMSMVFSELRHFKH